MSNSEIESRLVELLKEAYPLIKQLKPDMELLERIQNTIRGILLQWL